MVDRGRNVGLAEQALEATASDGAGVQMSWLDRPLAAALRLNWETVAWAMLVLVGTVARFYHLGVRAMSHDESLHSLYSYYLYDAGNYEHNPMMHGPLLFHMNALVYFLFGDNDTTARLMPALFGIGVIAMAYAYRRYIGRAGALAMGLMVTISPSLLFHSRYIRDDIYIAFFALVWVYTAMRYLDTRDEHRFRWLTLMVLAMAFGFVTMENQFIHGALFGLFFGAFALWEVIGARMLLGLAPGLVGAGLGVWLMETGQRTPGLAIALLGVAATVALLAWWLSGDAWRKLRVSESGELAVLMAALVMPFLAPFGHLALGWDAMAHGTTQDLLRSGVFVLLLTGVSAALAYYWFGMRRDSKSVEGAPLLTFAQWGQLMGLFWLIAVLFFTTFLTNTKNGLATGIVGSLGYWLAQQEVARGGQPWYYYPMIGSLYEFLPIVLTVGAMVTGLAGLRRDDAWDPVSEGDLPHDGGAVRAGGGAVRNRRILLAFVLWWTVGAWAAYSVAGEKMPWLLVHLALPMCVAGGWWFGRVVRGIDWSTARQNGAIWLIGAPAAFIFGVMTVWTRLPGGGRSLDALATTMQWLVAALAVMGVGYGVWLGANRIGWPATRRLGMVGVAGLLLLLTIRFSYLLTYVNYDMATEYLVYAHATPDIKRMLAEIDLVSQRTVGESDIVVAYDDETSWPLSWYMRKYPNAKFYGSNPTSDSMSAPIVIVGPKNYEKVRPYVARDYVKRVYRQMWWPDQGYFGMTWSRFVETVRDPARMKRIFEIVFYRRYADDENPSDQRDLTKWPTRKEMEMYVRKDLAEQVWDLNVVPLTQLVDPQEQMIQARNVDMAAFGSILGEINGLPLLTPRAVAVAVDGRRVIADTGNHRIVITDANGGMVVAFGSLCRLGEGAAGGCVDPDGAGALELGDGQFNEPWGVAVDSQGRIFVADTWNGRIQVFDADGRFIRKWGIFNTTNGELGDPNALFGPRGIAVDTAGNLLVADTGNKRILQFTVDGALVRQVGGGGVLIGRFEEPTAVAVDPRDGSVFVADAWNRRIQKLSPTLEPLAEWPVASWGSEHLYYKPYITVTGTGDVYVTDPENFRVLVFNSAGGLKGAFGSFGVEMNRFGLPNGIAWDSAAGLVLVADADNQRVQVFSPIP